MVTVFNPAKNTSVWIPYTCDAAALRQLVKNATNCTNFVLVHNGTILPAHGMLPITANARLCMMPQISSGRSNAIRREYPMEEYDRDFVMDVIRYKKPATQVSFNICGNILECTVADVMLAIENGTDVDILKRLLEKNEDSKQ